MLVRTFASAMAGIDAATVTIEVNVSRGVRFFLVGLPDVADFINGTRKFNL